ncbi:MAG: hypothetical protein HC887_13460, partial [Desulfobacteraceae bacterium]|nr:hypothetical protein [Desulfobacteraceae bacterium]
KSTIGPQIVKDKNPYAIIALGGYGREEMCVHSDIDLLFLFRKTFPKPRRNWFGKLFILVGRGLGCRTCHPLDR